MNSWNSPHPLSLQGRRVPAISCVLFYLSFALYLLMRTGSTSFLRYSEFPIQDYVVIGYWICYALCLVNIFFFCRYSIFQILLIAAFEILGLYVWKETKHQEYFFFMSMMLPLSCRYLTWEKLIRGIFPIFFVISALPVALYAVGIFQELELYRGEIRRYTLGYSHPNVLGMRVFLIILLIMMIRYEKLTVWDYLLFLAAAAFNWFVPNSKTACFSCLLMIVLVWIFKRGGSRLVSGLLIRLGVTLAFPVMAAFSVLACYFYDPQNPLLVKIDTTLFTTRLSFGHQFFANYDVTWFGQKLKLIGSIKAASKGVHASILDNSYVRVLLGAGLTLFLVLMVLLVLGSWRCAHLKNPGMMIGVILIAVYCVYEFEVTKSIHNLFLFQSVFAIFGENAAEPLQRRRRARRR